MMQITFEAECPHCKESQNTSIAITSHTKGDFVVECDSCFKKYIITWYIIADSEVHKITSVSPPVRCRAEIEPYYIDDDDENDEFLDEPQA
jgi:hypothetical protein